MICCCRCSRGVVAKGWRTSYRGEIDFDVSCIAGQTQSSHHIDSTSVSSSACLPVSPPLCPRYFQLGHLSGLALTVSPRVGRAQSTQVRHTPACVRHSISGPRGSVQPYRAVRSLSMLPLRSPSPASSPRQTGSWKPTPQKERGFESSI